MFVDRYDSWQSDEEFLKIEGVKIVSETPVPPIEGEGTGCVAVIGEALKHRTEPTEVFSSQEIRDLFGTFADFNNPGGPINASTGVAEPGLNPTSYDGNLFLAIRGRKFKRLILVGVDQSCKDAAGAALEVDLTITADSGTTVGNVVIPAGVRVAITGATPADVFATIDDVVVAADDFTGSPAAKTVKAKVRRVKGTTASSVTIAQVLSDDATSAVPGYTLSAAATWAAVADPNIASAYADALDLLLADESPMDDVDIVYLARHLSGTQGETLMKAAKQHVIDASAKGKGRRVVVSPPLGTAVDDALDDTSGTVGVGNVGDDERVDYAYPGVKMYAPELAAAACSATQFPDGLLYWPSDSMLACCEAAVQPEVNPGVKTNATGWVLGVEAVASTDGGTVAPLNKAQYIALRAGGIAVPKKERSTYVVQSGITSKGPEYTIKRRRMADYIEDSVAQAMEPYQKQPATRARKDEILGLIVDFLAGLKSEEQPQLARIEDFEVSDKGLNTTLRSGKGIYVVEIQVRLLASLDAIVFKTLIGETIEILRAE